MPSNGLGPVSSSSRPCSTSADAGNLENSWARSNNALRAPLDTRREGFRSAGHRRRTRKKGETSPVPMLMLDSHLKGAERALQQSFRKLFYFNGLLLGAFVLLAYLPIHGLPGRKVHPATIETVQYQAVVLPPAEAPLRLAG